MSDYIVASSVGDYEKAKRHGEQSLQEAIDASDAVWQLNAKVLIAHSQTKLRQYRDAEQTFSEALTLARDQSKSNSFFFAFFLSKSELLIDISS